MCLADKSTSLRLNRDGFREKKRPLDLPSARYGFGVSWQPTVGCSIDLDLQCVVVNQVGVITDCAYYNNLKAAGSITHSGDEQEGRASGIQEMVWANCKKLPQDVVLLIFVVAAYSGGTLTDVTNGMFHVLENHEDVEIAHIEMGKSNKSVDVVAAVYKDTNGWKLCPLDVPAETGRHFMDILPTLCGVIQQFVPGAPQRQKVAFAMEKGGIMDFPTNMGRVIVGLGWDVDDGECDLDVSAVLMGSKRQYVETVFWGCLSSEKHGIFHTGDNLTGEGDGDDEQIICEMGRIGEDVHEVVFVVNIYTNGRSFKTVANPSCRVVDESTGEELCKYSLRSAGDQRGLIIAKLRREIGNRWAFHALGMPCPGKTWHDAMPHIVNVCELNTASLALRGNSCETSGTPQMAAKPRKFPTSSACNVM